MSAMSEDVHAWQSECAALRRQLLEARGLLAEVAKMIREGYAQQAETQATDYLKRTNR